MIGDDLVNSYHLLLCCLDLIFANALLCPNRRDLLNPSFKGMVGIDYLQSTVLCSLGSFEMKLKVGCLPPSSWFPGLPVEFHTLEMKASEDPPCVIAALCELHDGLLVEAKGIKEHYFKPYIAKLLDRKVHLGSVISTCWCSVVVSRSFKSCRFHRGEQRNLLMGKGAQTGAGFLCVLAGAEFPHTFDAVCSKISSVSAFYVSEESLLSFFGSVKLNHEAWYFLQAKKKWSPCERIVNGVCVLLLFLKLSKMLWKERLRLQMYKLSCLVLILEMFSKLCGSFFVVAHQASP